MDSTVSIEARSVQHGSDGIPTALTEESPLCINLRMEASGPLPANADLILTAHELFGSRTKVLPDPIPDPAEALGGTIRLRIPGDHFVLSPGCWHILVDLMQGEKSLAGTNAGSTELYVRDAGESPLYSRACHNLARAEYAFDRRHGIYLAAYTPLLPPSVDPFSDEDASEFSSRFATDLRLTPAMVHDAGLGFLLAAHAFRALGHGQRAEYCEESICRTVHTICGLMKEEDGRLHALTGVDRPHRPGEHRREDDAMALKFLAQTYFYFSNGPREEKDYARYVLDEAKDLFRCQLDQPLAPAAVQCPAGAGPILAGPAWYCLAHKAEHGQYFAPDARKALIDLAVEAARHMLSGGGSYDGECTGQEAQHPWRADLALASGLLPVWRMVRDLSNRGDDQARAARDLIGEGIERTLALLTRGDPSRPTPAPPVPSAVPDHLRGIAWEVCEQYRRSFGDEPPVRQFARHLGARSDGAVTASFSDLSASGAALLLCPEYAALEPKPPLPWWD